MVRFVIVLVGVLLLPKFVDGHKLWNHAIPDCNMEHGRHGNAGNSFHLLGGDGDVFMVNSE